MIGPKAIVINICILVLTGSLYTAPFFIYTIGYSTLLTFSLASRLAFYILLAVLTATAIPYIYTIYPTYKYTAFNKHFTATTSRGFKLYYLITLI